MMSDTTVKSSHTHIDNVPVNAGLQIVTEKNVKSVPKIVITGKRIPSENSKVKAIPKSITVFVGRILKETSADDVKELLSENGIPNSYCKKLSGITKEGREYKSSAFLVSCEDKYKDILFHYNTWPVNTDVKEWVYKPRGS